MSDYQTYEELLNTYCFCDFESKGEKQNLILNQKSESISHEMEKRHKQIVINRFDFTNQINRLVKDLEGLDTDTTEVISAKNKSRRRYSESIRRSSYIGVTKNGDKWQALISINNRKTYINSYKTQHEAASAYDMHSIILHSLRAKTNFGYSKEEIMEMINQFSRN